MENTEQIKKALIEWLCSDYSIEDATNQIDKATVKITIKYDNGVKDIIEIKKGEFKHVNPYKPTQL